MPEWFADSSRINNLENINTNKPWILCNLIRYVANIHSFNEMLHLFQSGGGGAYPGLNPGWAPTYYRAHILTITPYGANLDFTLWEEARAREKNSYQH